MAADSQYLREHYASLSDDALLAIKRADLVETAQKCYDDELGRRNLASRGGRRREAGRLPLPAPVEALDENPELDQELDDEPAEDEPDWLDDAAEVLSRTDLPGAAPAEDMANAQEVLEAAGIPCYLDLYEIPEDNNPSPPPTHIWRLRVPGNLNLRATSILERDVFNQEFEAQWKTHLETLSDEELRGMKPEVAFCGLFDRVERVTTAYAEEIRRRRL
ncbi:MAG: hypothetical protein WBE37_26795 [Bryobacteraceae bacterium]